MIGPSLLYLTVYNPTLKPTGPVPDDDEDAEEQAQILFYTSGERAVSRDRMLRQIGLAKALVSFSSMFHTADACSHVHSQSRRMIMLSPEKDFWIHAGVEIGKTPRPTSQKAKVTTTTFDYNEASIHDGALKAQLLQTYERFKLTHGSFTTILSTLGKEALELQLERFFTPWAWSWDLEQPHEFSDQFPVPTHPFHRQLSKHLNTIDDDLPDELSTIAIVPPFCIGSDRYIQARHPYSLPRLLTSLVPPPLSKDPHPPRDTSRTPEEPPPPDKASASSSASSSRTFLGMPAMNLDMNMSVKKWRWPGYLTIGKGGKGKISDTDKDEDTSGRHTENEAKKEADSAAEQSSAQENVQQGAEEEVHKTTSNAIDTAIRPQPLQVDQSALDDAMTEADKPDGLDTSPSEHTSPEIAQDLDSPGSTIPNEDLMPTPKLTKLFEQTSSSVPVPEHTVLSPEFSSRTIHLAIPDSPFTTVKQTVHYLELDRILVALVGRDDLLGREQLGELARKADAAIHELHKAVEEDSFRKEMDTLSKAADQSKERHLVSLPRTTFTSDGFTSSSEHLFNGQQMLEEKVDMDIFEVFSKNQASLQQWNVSRRGLGTDSNTGEELIGEAFVEVLNKHATLPDVDNILSSTIRKNTH